MESQIAASLLRAENGFSGSAFAPLKAVVIELDATLYDPLRFDLSGINATCAWAADELGFDFGRLLGACRSSLSLGREVNDDFFARILEELSDTRRGSSFLYDYFLSHVPTIACHSGILPMIEMLGKRYNLGLMTDGDADLAAKKVKALGLEGRFAATYLWPDCSVVWSRLPALRWFEESLGASGDQMAYVGWRNSLGFGEAHSLDWHTVATGCSGGVATPTFARWTVGNPLETEEMLDALSSTFRPDKPHSVESRHTSEMEQVAVY